MAEVKTQPMTPEQISQIKTEIETFSQNSIKYASSQPVLSAHYNRLFRSSQSFLDRADKLEQAAKRKAHTEARKAAKESAKNGNAAAPTGTAPRKSA